jgi:UDP-N-acetylglucosamine--N-acetylmuramyl-(pentapeptide) pyrophosphoryl-undecaprenol N-acetylglucosamine transferase
MSYKLIITGGGTGGHLFPGIALAEVLCQTQDAGRTTQILFLCTERPFDKTQLDRFIVSRANLLVVSRANLYGFRYEVLPSPRLSWSIAFPVKLIKSFIRAYRVIGKMRPDYVIGLGGYGSFTSLVIARLCNIPIILLEQNFLPGRVTRWGSAWARWVCCQWSGSQKYLSNPLRARVVGSPVRREIKRIERRDACAKLGLDPSRKILAILGGSQGAEAINRFILDNLNLLTPYKNQLAIIHLTGAKDYETVKAGYQSTCLEHYVAAFSQEMARVYSAADLVLARAGGITIAELTALGIPAVLIPYPTASENHQYYNALEFARAGAGIMIEQKDLSSAKLTYIIKDLLLNPAVLAQMSGASGRLGHPQAGEEIITLIRLLRFRSQ